MIEVFKTNVNRKREAKQLLTKLAEPMPGCHFNFDLEDSDKILRVEARSGSVDVASVIELMNEHQYTCQLLED